MIIQIETIAHNTHEHSHTMSLWETVVHFLSDGVHLATGIVILLCAGVILWKISTVKADK